jgi:antitoxin component YwqK of YwqJK toxin-antitoxin module
MKPLPTLTLLLAAALLLPSCGPSNEAKPVNPVPAGSATTKSDAVSPSTEAASKATPPKEADYDSLKYSNGIYLDPDTGKPFTGIARQKHPDDTPRGEYPLKDGRFEGTVKEWYANGKPSAETEFKNGERSGRNIEWTEYGLPYRERVYDGDRIVSEKNFELGK